MRESAGNCRSRPCETSRRSHARDEPGISASFIARPIQAALASAGSIVAGAVMPLVVAGIAAPAGLIPLVSGSSLLFLRYWEGWLRAGGAGVLAGAIRVTFSMSPRTIRELRKETKARPMSRQLASAVIYWRRNVDGDVK